MTATTASAADRDVSVSGGLVILGPEHTELLRELDAVFTSWGRGAGAREILPPPVYPVRDLEKFDVYTNFPHLTLAAAPLELADGPGKPVDGVFDPSDLRGAQLGLPHATCYGAYLFHENTEVAEDTLVTLVNRCFRNEEHYTGLRRMLSFQMREIVALGGFEHTQRVIEEFTARITAFAGALGLPLRQEAASDPFFENDGGRALMQRLSPVKYEFLAGELSVASVNTHRNFFGERCNITLPDRTHAHTGCVAFGLERWVAVLLERHAGDAAAALATVRDAARRAG
ncbi:hypothetical protein [Streptomyces sp. HNM0574]|uniref:hypothetical protein n=1 Tax=Streptomyces sp. HNM0574 TaxID=2714954 RepID=UPI00146D1362|nr:hypothetical protein [Streptomyces sp. HNM0574]NLU66102.1 hypothetical protein [Streptomyces sp. HNM0574]